jgi:geranylgeranyl diphosphate synthase type II
MPDVCPERLLKVIVELSRAVGSEGMVAGQYLELMAQHDETLSFDDLRAIHVLKTAAYAECSTVCGAILADADEEQIESLRRYGRALGLLYEVVDDVARAKKQELPCPSGPPSYVRLLGLPKCQEYGKQLRSEAKSHLSSFDARRALPLLCFVDELYGRML